jgi:hypothetical protein
MKTLLMAVLQAYVDRGEAELGSKKLTHYLTARYGSVGEGKAKLGDLASIKDAYKRDAGGPVWELIWRYSDCEAEEQSRRH